MHWTGLLPSKLDMEISMRENPPNDQFEGGEIIWLRKFNSLAAWTVG